MDMDSIVGDHYRSGVWAGRRRAKEEKLGQIE